MSKAVEAKGWLWPNGKRMKILYISKMTMRM